jgi:hypothetical protein
MDNSIIDFYINEIKVLDFLIDKSKLRKIHFSDRIEYRIYDNRKFKYHNLYGPSIIWNNGNKDFYIDNIKYENEIDYKKKATVLLRKKKLRGFLKEKD